MNNAIKNQVNANSVRKYGVVKNATGFKVRCGEWYATNTDEMTYYRSEGAVFKTEGSAMNKIGSLMSVGQIKPRGGKINARIIPLKS